MADEQHKHEWLAIREGYPQKICKCGVLRTPGLKVGQNTITVNASPTTQEVIRWTSFHNASQVGDLGMSGIGRPQFFTAGKNSLASVFGEADPGILTRWQTNPNATTITATGTATTFGTPEGTLASVSTSSYGWGIQHTTAAVANSDGGWLPGAFTDVRGEHSFNISFVMRTGADITNVRFWIGVFGSDPMASSAPGTNHAAFRYDTGVDGTAFWRCLSSAAAAQQSTTTTSSISASTNYIMRIATDGSTYRFLINGTQVASHSTTVPTTTANMGPVCEVRTLNAASKVITNYRIVIGQDGLFSF